MKTKISFPSKSTIGWIAVILVSHLLVFGFRQARGARAEAVNALPTDIPNLVAYSSDQLYDLAIEAERNSEWEQAMIYLSAYMGKQDENLANAYKTKTELSHLSTAYKYSRYYYTLGTEAKRDQNRISRCLAEANVRWSYAVPPRAPAPLPTRVPAPGSSRPRAPESLYNEDFSGPSLNNIFQEGLPNSVYRPNSSARASYAGAPFYAFQNWDGASFLRLYNRLDDTQRKGWSTSRVFNPGNRAFRLELRFNPFTQSRDRGIDQLLEVWLLDSDNQHKHIRATVFSDGYGANRKFAYTNTLISKGQESGFGFENNKWYRLVITGSPNQIIKAAIYDDSGTRELVSLPVGSNLRAFPNGFRLGISQSVGFPGGRYPTDVGIDWIQLTAWSE
jgi:hypothetical protein